MKRTALIAMLVLMLTFANAQLKFGANGTNFMANNWNPDSWTWNPSNYSLLNPNNYTMSHSMSFSTSYSSGLSLYQSRYTNHISYQVNDKLDINVDLHLTNFGSANISKGFNIEGNDDNSTDIVPDFSVNYRPTENTSIHFVFRGGSENPYFRRNNIWRD